MKKHGSFRPLGDAHQLCYLPEPGAHGRSFLHLDGRVPKEDMRCVQHGRLTGFLEFQPATRLPADAG